MGTQGTTESTLSTPVLRQLLAEAEDHIARLNCGVCRREAALIRAVLAERGESRGALAIAPEEITDGRTD